MTLGPHPFTLRQLQYVVAVADNLSFSRAAAQCAVSQPALSSQLGQLEEVLGLRLFERDRRRVIPTAAGRSFVDRARALLVEADELLETARRAGDPFSGEVRIGVIPTVGPYLLPLVVPALRRRFPRLRIFWKERRTDELLRKLEAGALDAAVIAQRTGVGDLVVRPIADDPFVLAAPKDHPLSKAKGSASMAELREEDVLLLEEGHCFREQALAFCGRARARELEFRATSLHTLAQMVAGGAGVTLLPSLAVKTEAARADLRVRPLADPAPRRTVTMVFRPKAALAPALEAIAGALKEAYPAARQTSGRPGPPARGAGRAHP